MLVMHACGGLEAAADAGDAHGASLLGLGRLLMLVMRPVWMGAADALLMLMVHTC